MTFYLHLFPYSYYTQPLLQAWWQSIEKLRDGDHTTLFFDTRDYFSAWERFQEGIPLRYYRMKMDGIGIPTLSEALSNTPVLPLIVSGRNYGMQFLIALEKTALLAQWFDCRVLLSRMPVPSLNLANEYIGQEPVALLVENAPRVMSWLVSDTSFTRPGVEKLCHKLSKVHQIADTLAAMMSHLSRQSMILLSQPQVILWRCIMKLIASLRRMPHAKKARNLNIRLFN